MIFKLIALLGIIILPGGLFFVAGYIFFQLIKQAREEYVNRLYRSSTSESPRGIQEHKASQYDQEDDQDEAK